MEAITLIARSLRLLRVIDRNEAPEEQEGEDAMLALNKMMRRWEANGLALGWSDISGIHDELPIPPEADEAVTFNLAKRLAPEYGVVPDQEVLDTARQGLTDLRTDVKNVNPVASDYTNLPYNILTDGYDGGLP